MNKDLVNRHLFCSRRYEKQLSQITKPLFTHSLVKYFSYNRFYRDQKWIGFYTDVVPVELSLIDNRGPLFVDQHGIAIDTGIYFHGDLREIFKTTVVADHVERFFSQEQNPKGQDVVTNGLLIIRKGMQHDESFYFSMLDQRVSASRAYYFQAITMIKQFCLYFLHKARTLIKEAERYKITYAVPPSGQEIFPSLFCKDSSTSHDHAWFDTKKFCINARFGDVFLSEQELNCLRLIAGGHSYAEIAAIMGLQMRTVESYVTNVKNKLNVSTRAALAHCYRRFAVLDACEQSTF